LEENYGSDAVFSPLFDGISHISEYVTPFLKL
jgi:hypothetical protein